MNAPIIHRPSPAFIAASWVALLLGAVAYLVGLSRQRVNEALASLQAQEMIRVEYGGLRVLDIQGLRSSGATR